MALETVVNIHVDFYDNRYTIINAKQYDTRSRFISITCYDKGNLFQLNSNQHFAYIKLLKPDGYTAFNSCRIDYKGNVLVELTEQMLSTAGMCYADLIVINKGSAKFNVDTGEIITIEGSPVLSTMAFCVNVYDTPVDNSSIESSYEYNALNDLMQRAEANYNEVILLAKSYAKGNAEDIRDNEDFDNAKYYYEQALISANNAETSENNASISEENAKESENASKISETNAKTSEVNAKESELNSATSEQNALTSEQNASTSEQNAKDSETKSATSEANAKVSETNAKVSEDKAKVSETKSATSEANAKVSETNAKNSEIATATSEQNAKESETNAYTSEQNAKVSETNAKASETKSATSEENSAISEQNAKASETNAKASETNASNSETNAKASEIIAVDNANKSQSYAIGGTGTRENEDQDNARYYYSIVKNIVDGLNSGFIPMGSIYFSELAAAEKATGFTYNIKDDFTTDSTFREGAGQYYTAGTNVFLCADGLWDCLGGSAPVTATVDEVKNFLEI